MSTTYQPGDAVWTFIGGEWRAAEVESLFSHETEISSPTWMLLFPNGDDWISAESDMRPRDPSLYGEDKPDKSKE
jgi:hypothetical protein